MEVQASQVSNTSQKESSAEPSGEQIEWSSRLPLRHGASVSPTYFRRKNSKFNNLDAFDVAQSGCRCSARVREIARINLGVQGRMRSATFSANAKSSSTRSGWVRRGIRSRAMKAASAGAGEPPLKNTTRAAISGELVRSSS